MINIIDLFEVYIIVLVKIMSNGLIAFGLEQGNIIVTRTEKFGSYVDSLYDGDGIVLISEPDFNLSQEEVLQLVQDYNDAVAAEKAERDNK